MGIVYIATNVLNGKSYVGVTIHSLMSRQSEHLLLARQNSPLYFHRALRKYGADKFEWKELEHQQEVPLLLERERFFINLLKTKGSKGYNMTDGGEGTPGKIITETARLNMGKAQIGNKNALGCKRSPETRQKLRKSKLGKKTGPRSSETCQKIAAAVTGNRNWLGRKHTDETKRKMSARQKGIKRGPLSQSHRENLIKAHRKRREIHDN